MTPALERFHANAALVLAHCGPRRSAVTLINERTVTCPRGVATSPLVVVCAHVHDVEAAGMKTLVAGQVLVYDTAPARDGRLKAVNLRLL